MLNLNTPFRPVRRRSPGVKNNRSLTHKTSLQVGKKDHAASRSLTGGRKRTPAANSHIKYAILWRKVSHRKNKPWDGDGVLRLNKNTDSAIVKDEDGTFLGKVFKASESIFGEDAFKCGSAIECQLNGELESSADSQSQSSADLSSGLTMKMSSGLKRHKIDSIPSSKRVKRISTISGHSSVKSGLLYPAKSVLDKKNSRKHNFLSDGSSHSSMPLYNIAEIHNPLIMDRPGQFGPPGTLVKDVVVDPALSCKLRPHQREGIKFLYNCVMGFNSFAGNGAILADEMGLGKTLQTISLIWTLLKQTPYVDQKPIISNKVLICCPVTLVANWKKEFHKWLGRKPNSPSVLALDGAQQSFRQKDRQIVHGFSNTKVYKVLIVGYEKMQSLEKELAEAKFDLLVCDEGHRLKNSLSKSFKALQRLDIRRRIILTGTPIQNDLTEFYNLISFVNPGVLGSFKEFQKKFIKPILRSRETGCRSKAVISLGKQRTESLVQETKKFILRRTNTELVKYLPKRSDYVLFVPPSRLQLELFRLLAKTKKYTKIMEEEEELQSAGSRAKPSVTKDSLSLMTTFRKICNSPSLLEEDLLFREICDDASGSGPGSAFAEQLGKKVKSGKINLLMKLLTLIYRNTQDEKVIVVSNFTQVLDVIEKTIQSLRLSYSRLDGSTPSKDRSKLVDSFNKSTKEACFVFLLSSKAGGMGLNLVGASRLILFDNDWNPSVDLQAMARIHREGQKRHVRVYRLLTSGCIDEKIFQRQLIKRNLSDRFVDDSASSDADFFSYSDLRDIFTVSEDCQCGTHDLMLCGCDGLGTKELDCTQDDDLVAANDEAEDDEPESFVTALKFSQNCVNDENETKNRAKKQIQRCLRGFRHIDPVAAKSETPTDDAVINTLVVDQDPKKPLLSYIFAKY